MKKDMTKGVEWRHILLFALPIMAANLLQQMYNTADSIIVGNFIPDPGAFASVATTGAVTFMLLAFAMGLGIGVSVVTSQLFGARQNEKLGISVDTALILLGAVGVVVMIIGYAVTPWLLETVLSVPAEIRPNAQLYLNIYLIGLPFQFIYNCIASILRGVGDSKASLYFLLFTSVTDIGMNLLSVLVFKWGIAGIAGSTSLAQALCVVISYRYLRKRFPFRKGETHYDSKLCKTILKIGLPTALQQSIVSFGNIAMQRLVNSFNSTSIIDAYGAGSRLNNFVFVPILGFQSALASFTGQNISANRLDRVKRGYHSTLVMGLAATVIICLILYFSAAPVVSVFGLAEESLSIGVDFVRFLSKIFWIFAGYMILGGVLQGAGDTMLQSIATLSALAVRVVLGYVGVFVFHWFTHEAAWETNLYGWAIAIIITNVRYFTGGWKNKVVARRAEGPTAADFIDAGDM